MSSVIVNPRYHGRSVLDRSGEESEVAVQVSTGVKRGGQAHVISLERRQDI